LRAVANKALLVVFKRRIGELGRRVRELGERFVYLVARRRRMVWEKN
jgi:hypothetical protein